MCNCVYPINSKQKSKEAVQFSRGRPPIKADTTTVKIPKNPNIRPAVIKSKPQKSDTVGNLIFTRS